MNADRRVERSRAREAGPGQAAYRVYLVVMLLLTVGAPLLHLAWTWLTTPEVVAALAAPEAPHLAASACGLLWAGGLLLGRERGPVLHSPFRSWLLGSSDAPRWRAFGRGMSATLAVTSGLGALAAAAIIGALSSAGLAGDGALFIAASACAALIAAVAWLLGQAFPRSAALLAAGIVIAVAASLLPSAAASGALPWSPLATLFPVLPGAGRAVPPGGGWSALSGLACLAAAGLAVVPWAMSRLRLETLVAQSNRWQSATSLATMMEFGGAAELYRARPRIGRRWPAWHRAGARRRTPLPLRLLRVDAVAAARTPVRATFAAVTLLAAGALLTAGASVPAWPLGAAAGVLAFWALGPFTDGMHHAAQAASDLALYGLSDERLLASQLLFPLLAALLCLGGGAAVVMFCGAPALGALVPALLLAPASLLLRLADALKGPLPAELLSPIPTPAGDAGALLRVGWALDAVLFAGLLGAALAAQQPIVAGLLTAAAGLLCARRWRARR